ncbi:MAG: hypothetical protein NTX55_00195 [Candidatus Parcubacteria bacterium]|nr:hypothetical protein [Candidatus Parcubacteria bacterium]
MENFCQIGKLEHKDGYDVCRGENRQGELRFDLTKIFPSCQTAGHYHFGDEPELYEVISGEAEFLTQNRDATQTYIIGAKEKDKIIFPPGFSMRTINPSGNKELIVSNWKICTCLALTSNASQGGRKNLDKLCFIHTC